MSFAYKGAKPQPNILHKNCAPDICYLVLVGARQKGDSKWEKPVSAKICGFLRKSAVSCGFLRKFATPKSLDLQSEPKINENLQKSAKMCVPGPVSPFCCLPFAAPCIGAGSGGIVLGHNSQTPTLHWIDFFRRFEYPKDPAVLKILRRTPPPPRKYYENNSPRKKIM